MFTMPLKHGEDIGAAAVEREIGIWNAVRFARLCNAIDLEPLLGFSRPPRPGMVSDEQPGSDREQGEQKKTGQGPFGFHKSARWSFRAANARAVPA